MWKLPAERLSNDPFFPPNRPQCSFNKGANGRAADRHREHDSEPAPRPAVMEPFIDELSKIDGKLHRTSDWRIRRIMELKRNGILP